MLKHAARKAACGEQPAVSMTQYKQFNDRVRAIGREIFALADAAQPKVWQKAWWLERGTQMLDHDEALRTRAFQFVDCLPSLRTNADLLRHLGEYLDPRYVRLPKVAHALMSPGPLQSMREDLLGFATHTGARQMAGRFITGYDVPSVLKTLTRLRHNGMAFTLDVLGEFTTSRECADHYAQVYHDLMDRLAPLSKTWPDDPLLDRDAYGPMPRINLSIKLTGLDPFFDAIDPERAIANVGARLRPLLRQARDLGIFLNIDMESFKYRDLTLDLFERILSEA